MPLLPQFRKVPFPYGPAPEGPTLDNDLHRCRPSVSYFLRMVDSPPNPEFEKVVYEYAVAQWATFEVGQCPIPDCPFHRFGIGGSSCCLSFPLHRGHPVRAIPARARFYFAASSGGTVNVTLPVAAHSTPRVNVTLKTCSVTALKSWPRASTNTRPWPYCVVHSMGSWTPAPDMGCLLRASDALSS